MGFLWDEEAQSTGEQKHGHDRESEKQERSSPVRVDGEQGGEGKDEVDSTEAEGSVERCSRSEPVFGEDCTGVEGDDIDTTHSGKGTQSLSKLFRASTHCWPIMTVKAAQVARLTRGITNNSCSRRKKLSALRILASSSS